ncbi:EFR1 family ferrodoxin [Anaerobium acetethylicum]|uniref:Flavodoxin n=1 Tax=Anaerobium acetethylicum TaxID=1619234 RepID=A0A1D3TWD0_9FIRM|nr:EFR1 family ferrodoxin [Anaerobium acetethylicum]SCP98523.1 Flavodoxin [Anaerobium acetethylicum]
MKVLIIYFSQSGNTKKIAHSIAEGARGAAEVVDIKSIKHVNYEMMQDYDLIGLGSPVWKADPPNIRRFYENAPDQKGKHIFSFATHGTMPGFYFPVVLPNLKKAGFTVIGSARWYGNVVMPGMPEPYYTAGHPDEQDCEEAKEFGKEMVLRSRRISAGETGLIPPMPKNDIDPDQAVAIVNMLLEYGNPQGKIIRDPEKCIYPKCSCCMDYCTMDYIDLSCTPQKFGSEGCCCDDNHECAWCFMICPTGAIRLDPDVYEHIKPSIGVRKTLFEKILNEAEEKGDFRRHVPADEVGFNTPYVIAHQKHPYFRVPPMNQNED